MQAVEKAVTKQNRSGIMKLHIDLDFTPEEARAFLGMPDVKPLQEAMMQRMQERMESALQGMDGESLFKMWLPVGMQGLEQLQKFFWGQMGARTDQGEKK